MDVVLSCKKPEASEEMHDNGVLRCAFSNGVYKTKIVAKELYFLLVVQLTPD